MQNKHLLNTNFILVLSLSRTRTTFSPLQQVAVYWVSPYLLCLAARCKSSHFTVCSSTRFCMARPGTSLSHPVTLACHCTARHAPTTASTATGTAVCSCSDGSAARRSKLELQTRWRANRWRRDWGQRALTQCWRWCDRVMTSSWGEWLQGARVLLIISAEFMYDTFRLCFAVCAVYAGPWELWTFILPPRQTSLLTRFWKKRRIRGKHGGTDAGYEINLYCHRVTPFPVLHPYPLLSRQTLRRWKCVNGNNN